MKIHYDIKQHSPEWYALKVGKPSTSNFHRMMANKPNTKFIGDSVHTYALELALERYTGEITETPDMKAMKRGTRLEPKAREYYIENTFRKIIEIGGIDNYGCFCSTDGIEVSNTNDRMLEIKCHDKKIHFEYLQHPDKFLNDHKWQLQGELFVSERKYVDLVGYHPKFRDKQIILTVERDEKLQIEIQNRVSKFLPLIDEKLEIIKNTKAP